MLLTLTPEQAQALLHDWRFWARPEQLPPGALANGKTWRTWLLLAGRGFGKTRCLSEWVRWMVESGRGRRGALIGRTAADVRDVIVDGESGILNICPPSFRPSWQPSKRRLVWPNGAKVTTFSADEPDALRGPQHDFGACDELASWRYPAAWDNYQFGLRLGDEPQTVVATTPRPTKIIKSLMKSPTTFVTRGTTYDNRANLAPAFFAEIINQYEGTRLGRQELNAEVLEDTPGALWTMERLEANRINPVDLPDLKRVVVAIDPEVSSEEGSAETGIIVAGIDGQRVPHGFVLADCSIRGTPDEWATAALEAYQTYEADRIVGEANQGGDMVISVIMMTALSLWQEGRLTHKSVPTKKVHATRGKELRAEPVAALYEQGRVHHVGAFPGLESQQTTWVPGQKSPDRMDALVWALTELMVAGTKDRRLHTW